MGKRESAETDLETKSTAYDSLRQYVKEAGRYELLSPKEQIELAIRCQEQEDAEAGRRLVVCNLRLVIKIAFKFKSIWMQNLLDLIQEGNLGLMHAVDKFDPHRGVKFSTYAAFWIKAYILKYIMKNWRLVKIGTTKEQRNLFYLLNKEKDKLINAGIDPSVELLAQKTGYAEEDIIMMEQRVNGNEMSLDTSLDRNLGWKMHDYFRNESKSQEELYAEMQIESLVRSKIDGFRSALTPRETDILDSRILAIEPATLNTIAERQGVTRERIRQIEADIMVKLKSHFKRQKLRSLDL